MIKKKMVKNKKQNNKNVYKEKELKIIKFKNNLKKVKIKYQIINYCQIKILISKM